MWRCSTWNSGPIPVELSARCQGDRASHMAEGRLLKWWRRVEGYTAQSGGCMMFHVEQWLANRCWIPRRERHQVRMPPGSRVSRWMGDMMSGQSHCSLAISGPVLGLTTALFHVEQRLQPGRSIAGLLCYGRNAGSRSVGEEYGGRRQTRVPHASAVLREECSTWNTERWMDSGAAGFHSGTESRVANRDVPRGTVITAQARADGRIQRR